MEVKNDMITKSLSSSIEVVGNEQNTMYSDGTNVALGSNIISSDVCACWWV